MFCSGEEVGGGSGSLVNDDDVVRLWGLELALGRVSCRESNDAPLLFTQAFATFAV